MNDLNDTLVEMNSLFFEWYIKPTVWYAEHIKGIATGANKCETCDHGQPTKACYIAFLKTFGDPE